MLGLQVPREYSQWVLHGPCRNTIDILFESEWTFKLLIRVLVYKLLGEVLGIVKNRNFIILFLLIFQILSIN